MVNVHVLIITMLNNTNQLVSTMGLLTPIHLLAYNGRIDVMTFSKLYQLFLNFMIQMSSAETDEQSAIGLDATFINIAHAHDIRCTLRLAPQCLHFD